MILSCEEVAKKHLDEIKKTINHWESDGMYRGPALGIAGLTTDMAAPYIKGLTKDANDVGIVTFGSFAPTPKELIDAVKQLNKNPSVHGIIVYHDAAGKVAQNNIDNLVDWQKDVDGNTFIQRGLAATVFPDSMYKYVRLPATVNAALKLAWFYSEGRRVSIFGRGPVGQGCANVFAAGGYSVMHLNSNVTNLRFACDFSDVLILAQSPGKKYKFDTHCLTKNPNLLIIDIGGNLDDDSGLINMAANVRYIRDIGKMTRAMLLDNLVTNWCMYEEHIPNIGVKLDE